MKKLYLYTAFHFNLAFSSIPEEQYPLVIDYCYWPILELLEEFPELKLGLEFSGETLEAIAKIDHTYIEQLKEHIGNGQAELIGAGYSQIIAPLWPEKINFKNLAIGNKVYKDLLGLTPKSAYINEQIFSNGNVDLYLENGYENIIMEFNNSAIYNNFAKEVPYQSHKLKGEIGEINLVWNNSIAFQKFQQYIFAWIEKEEYLDYILSHYNSEGDRSFLLYGSDVEIFDYKPGDYDYRFFSQSNKEIKKIYDLIDTLLKNEKVELVIPNYVAENFNSDQIIELGTSEYPLICKKQPKYNAVRWAVSGIEDTKINTKCYQIYNKINQNEFINPDNIGSNEWKEMVYLCGSDFRTKTTEDKISMFHEKAGAISQKLDKNINYYKSRNSKEEEIFIINFNKELWSEGLPYEVKLKFDKGKFYYNDLNVLADGKEILFQLEQVEFYRDNSIRTCVLALALPQILPGEKIKIHIIEGEANFRLPEVKLDGNRIITDQVNISFLDRKPGIIEGLSFPQIDNQLVLGTIPHGYYDHIKYSPDFFSGHTIIRDTNLKKITDLDNSEIIYPDDLNRYPVRIPVKSKIKGDFGVLWKVYYIYTTLAKVDISYYFRFNDLNPIYFRTGIFTVNPEFFNFQNLKYTTINGGKEEKYKFGKMSFDHTEMVSLDISANTSLGATEGWVSIEDNLKGVVFWHDNSELYSVPMLSYKNLSDNYFLRITHSISESDDTGRIFWRGHSKCRFSISGFDIRNRQRHLEKISLYNKGLLVIQ
ncbi:alpha-amylase [Iocasia frigidifontis]|uniref:Alpha-amylase n=1 Tax=Iocasia fonsfrigidae TaxID=2682810 RepID=A0A8A7KDH4_9FIRM|nr:hypothetical protein [Iocasia fonsfrigidae]QTL96947.1 alpha-amylase [Iocasia fonsfrigidae]